MRRWSIGLIGMTDSSNGGRDMAGKYFTVERLGSRHLIIFNSTFSTGELIFDAASGELKFLPAAGMQLSAGEMLQIALIAWGLGTSAN